MRAKLFIFILACMAMVLSFPLLADKNSKDKGLITSNKILALSDVNNDGEISLENLSSYNNLDRSYPQRPQHVWPNTDYDAASYTGAISSHQADDRNTAPESETDLKDFKALALVITPFDKQLFQADRFSLFVKSQGVSINLYQGGWSGNTSALSGASTLTHLTTTVAGADFTQLNSANFQVQTQSTHHLLRLAFEVISNATGEVNQEACIVNPKDCYLEFVLKDSKQQIVSSTQVYVNFLPIKMSYRLPHEEQPEVSNDRFSAGGFDNIAVDPDLPAIGLIRKPTFRVLPGVRVKLEYMLPTGSTLNAVSWTFPQAAGRVCSDFNALDETCTGNTATGRVVYWQANGNLDTVLNEIDVAVSFQYALLPCVNCETAFQISHRELEPVANKPMRGTDVAMLEQMLWQLGISPQHDSPGTKGVRLGDFSPALQGVVGGQAGSAGRSFFSTGMAGVSGSGSMERMIRRFKNRSFESTEAGIKGTASRQNSVFENATLQKLSFVWRDYNDAVRSVPQTNYLFSDIPQVQWTGLVNAMAGTVNFTFPESQQVQTELVYNNAVHQSAMRARGNSDVTREALMRAWVSKENNRHWGANSTPFRISEGGADEVGSIGFSQIWFAYMYGALANCEAFNNINMYHPHNNLLGFAVWAGIDDCGGSFYRAFHTEHYTLPNDPQTTARLVGYQCTENSEGVAQANGICPYAPDNYERLVKGLVGYNAGKFADRLVSCTLPEMLAGGVSRPNNKPGEGGNINCQASARQNGKQLDYGLTILHGTLPQTTPPDTNKLALPYRSYIWLGAEAVENNPATPEDESQDAWCFAYGEQEWRDPDLHPVTQQPLNWVGYRDLARIEINRRSECE